MRYSVENQRNIAFFLLDSRRNQYSISQFFFSGEPVIIYGYDFIGREIYQEIKIKVNVLCFIDRSHDGEHYDDIGIYSLDNPQMKLITRKYDKIKLINSIISDSDRVKHDVLNKIQNVKYCSLYDIFAECKIKYNVNFQAQQSMRIIQSLNRVVSNKKPDFDNIVLVGTTYTLLLTFLYLDNWKDTIFIMEKYVASFIEKNMQRKGIRCLRENYSGEYYDLCYMLAKYSKIWGVSILGHDHMNLSRAFLSCGIIVIEDGLANYDFEYSKEYRIILDNGRIYRPFGYDEIVNRVVLTGQFNLPIEIENKIELISPLSLWKKKNIEDKKEIMEIIGFPYDDLIDNVRKGRNIVFLTEASMIADGNKLTIEQHVDLYKKILSNYPSDNIMIKPHPSDYINYEEYFPDYFVLERRFPVEMIEWCDIRVKKFIISDECSCRDIFKENFEVDVFDFHGLIRQ